MTHSLALPTLASLLALTVAQPAAAAPAAAVAAAEAASAERIVSAARLDRAAVAELYRQAVLADAVAPLRDRWEALAAPSAPPRRRALALLALALTEWQDGRSGQAMAAIDRALTLDQGFDVLLLKAQLLDAAGYPDAAAAFEKAAALAPDAERAALVTRGALAASAPAALVALARQSPPPARDRLAQALALIGRPGDAVALFDAHGSGGAPATGEVELAQWALAAGNGAAARRAAWDAYATATNVIDRRYALALLAESYRQAGDLPGLLRDLDGRPADAAVQEARVDALLELGRNDQAIALVRAGPPALRARLPAILDLAQRRPALIAEYERLIAARPHDEQPYDSLAELYLAEGDRAGAIAVYRRLLDANRGSTPVLTGAARRMIGMGLVDPALAMVATLDADPAATVPVQLFLADAYRGQGREEEALATLAALRRRLPRTSRSLADVADGYESLGRKDLALATLTDLEVAGVPLDYDQQVHMADLAAGTGHPAEAVARLRRLWNATLLPARRGYLGQRIVALSAAAGTLDTLSRDLDARLAAGTIDAADLDLLLQIRLAAHDSDGAQAVVARFAARAGDDPKRLEQLAGLYARLKDYDRLNAVYARLAQVDPAQASFHLQRLLDDIVRGRGAGTGDDQRRKDLPALVARFQAADGEGKASALAFGAQVYALAGLTDRAIGQYRLAAAASPRDDDVALRYAVLLAQRGDSAAAIATLQYRAEAATDTPSLLATLDGLLSVLASQPDTGTSERITAARRQAVMLWAERLVLARIATAGEDSASLAFLADLADDAGDSDLQRRAMEAALAIATGDGRAALLRQLIAASSASAEPGIGQAIGDNGRKVVYGRRLIALRKQLPPEVYTDLARALLAQGDVAGAEQAFALLEDVPGLFNTDEARGDAFVAAGYRDRALASYARGLLRSQDDDDLLLKTSILRETAGQERLANGWYWQALLRLLLRQPQIGDPSSDASQDARWYYETLSEGLIASWQAGTPEAAAIIDQLRRAVADTLARPDADQSTSWARQLRLQMMVRLAARIAAHTDDPAVLDGIDALLRPRFGSDADYRLAMASWRLRQAGAPVATTGSGADEVMAQARSRAADMGDPALAMALAFSRHDVEAIRALVATAIATERDRRAAGARPTGKPLLAPIQAALLQGAVTLPPAEFRSLVLAPIQAAPFHDLVFFDLLRAAPDLFARIEAAAGGTLLPPATLATLLVDHGNDPIPWIPASSRKGDPLQTIIARFTLDEQIGLYDAVVDRKRITGSSSALSTELRADLLHATLDAEQQRRVLAVAAKELMVPDDAAAPTSDRWPRQLLDLAAPSDRRGFLLRMADAVAARRPDDRYIPVVLRAWFGGDRDAALAALMQHYEALDSSEQVGDPAPSLVKTFFADEWRRGAEAFLADPHPSREAVAAFYRRYVMANRYDGFGGGAADRMRYLARLVAIDPGNPVLVADLADALLQADDRAGFIRVLAPYVDSHPADRDAATDLQLAYLIRREPGLAAAVAARTGVDATDPDWIVQLGNRTARARPTGGGATFGTLFDTLHALLEREQPTLAVVETLRRRRQADRIAGAAPVAGPLLAPVVAAFARDPASAVAVLHDLWRRSASNAQGVDETTLTRSAMLRAFPRPGPPADTGDESDEPDVPGLLDALTTTPAMTAELENDLGALEPVVQQAQQPLYDLIAAGLMKQGRAAARTAALLDALASNRIDRSGLQLLATLVNRQGLALSPDRLAVLRTALRRTANIGAHLNAELAGVFGRGGDVVTAQALLELALLQTLYPSGQDLPAASDQVRPAALVAILRGWPDKGAATRAYLALAAILDTARRNGIVPVMYDRLPPLGDGA